MPSFAAEPIVSQPRPMIFDTEMGADDWMAALMLIRHPAVGLKAITVVGTDLAQVKPGVEHALRLVKLAGKEGKVPVAAGLNEPLRGKHAFPETRRLRADQMEDEPSTPAPRLRRNRTPWSRSSRKKAPRAGRHARRRRELSSSRLPGGKREAIEDFFLQTLNR